jgi:hypothetical protein
MKIDRLYMPSLDQDDNIEGFSRITFPEVEKSIEELANLKEHIIVSKIGTSNTLLGYKDNEPQFIKDNPTIVIHEEYVHSFESALNIFGYSMRK